MSNLSQVKILIVDDHDEMAKLIALMLHRPDLDITIASDGISGLEQVKITHPDIIITDLMMPKMDGFALMERALAFDAHIPIIVVTAFGSMKSAIRALRLGAFDFITKPFSKTEVQRTVDRAVKQQIARRYEAQRRELTNALGLSRNLAQISEKFLSLIVKALDAQQGVIWWPESRTSPIISSQTDLKLADQLISWAHTAGLTDLPDNDVESRTFQPPADISPNASFPGALVGVPLVAHQNLEGLLILGHPQVDYFTDDDLAFLTSLAPFAALTINNAKTYSQLKATNDRLTSLQYLSTLTYITNQSINRISRLLVEGIRQNLRYPGVILFLPEEDGQTLIIRSAAGDLDKFLRRRGDAPTRRIAIRLDDEQTAICRAFKTRTVQETSLTNLVQILQQADASDMVKAIDKLPMRRYIFLPLWQGESVIGILGVGYFHDEPLLPNERNLLTSIANQTALVLKNALLYQTESQGRREMEALYQAGLVITSSLSQAEVLKTIIEQIVDLTFFESCIIGRWDERKNTEVIELYLQKTRSGWQTNETPGTAYALEDRPLVQEALQRRQLKVIRLDDPNLTPTEQLWMDQRQAKLRLIIPLIIRNESIGVLELITTQANRRFSAHISRITQGLAAQAAIALENARLHESELKRIEHEMDLAQRIQVSLLPHATPQIPGLTIAARSQAARLVGGDFYRYLSLPNGHFGVVIGDVSGKGVPGALYMAMTITAMDTQIRQQTAPGDMLQALNAVLHPRMQANRMNTALLIAIFNPRELSLQVANAGMIAPLIKQERGYEWLDVSGLPVGATANTTYNSRSVALAGRSTIILASDGIIEATNRSGQFYGFDRFQEAAQSMQHLPTSEQILDHIWSDVITFTDEAEPSDDMTMVVVQTWVQRDVTKILPKIDLPPF